MLPHKRPSTYFSPKPEGADRGARTRRPTEDTRIAPCGRSLTPLPQFGLVLTLDKDKRPLHLVKSTGPEGPAWKEERQEAWHRGHSVAFVIHFAHSSGQWGQR